MTLEELLVSKVHRTRINKIFNWYVGYSGILNRGAGQNIYIKTQEGIVEPIMYEIKDRGFDYLSVKCSNGTIIGCGIVETDEGKFIVCILKDGTKSQKLFSELGFEKIPKWTLSREVDIKVTDFKDYVKETK